VVRETEAVLENCHALINKIIAELSAEDSSAAELLLHLEFAGSALKRNVRTTSGRGASLVVIRRAESDMAELNNHVLPGALKRTVGSQADVSSCAGCRSCPLSGKPDNEPTSPND
jgi:hypothetical protein